MSLSTFFVVKDEAPTVLRALESVLPVTDQYVIGIDDKSSDGTREIVHKFAEDHPDKEFDIYDFTWENHFAKARNAAIERCTKDWIFQLDGHEYLYRSSTGMLQHYMENTPPHIWVISVRMYLEPVWGAGAADVIPEVLFIQTHLWKNLKSDNGSILWRGDVVPDPHGVIAAEPEKWKDFKGIRYEHASHNQITQETCPIACRLNTPDIVIVHDRPPENAAKRRVQRESMNTPHFLARLKEDPTDERGLFYGTMSFVDAAVTRKADGEAKYHKVKLRKAIPLARRYMKHHGEILPEQAFEMASKLGEVSRELGLQEFERGKDPSDWYKQAEWAFYKSMALQPQRAEGYYNLGVLCMNRLEYEGSKFKLPDANAPEINTNMYHLTVQAERWLMLAGQCDVPVTSYFVKGPMYHYMPLFKLTELYRAVYKFTGQHEYFLKGKRALEELMKKLPFNLDVKSIYDQFIEQYKSRRMELPGESNGKRVAVFNSTGQFTRDLISELEVQGYEIQEADHPNADAVLGADFIINAWADKNAISISQEATRAKQFVRLCRYEAFTEMPKMINWDNVDGLIVPSDAMREYVMTRFDIGCPVHVIKHGLNLDSYDYAKRGHGKNVAWVGYIHARKNLAELAEIVKMCPDKHFHIAGQVQQSDTWRAFLWNLRKAECEDRVTFHGWQDDINTWLDDIDANYLLSTSWGESFGYVIAEAMVKGIVPIVRDFEGADTLWPKWARYSRIEDVARLFDSRVSYRKSELTRQWIADNHDVKREAQQYMELFNNADK